MGPLVLRITGKAVGLDALDRAITDVTEFSHRAHLAQALRDYSQTHPRGQAVAWLLLATNPDNVESGPRPDCLHEVIRFWVEDLYEADEPGLADALAWALGEVGR